MLLERSVLGINTPAEGLTFLLQVGVLTLAASYFIFSLIIVRQVNLMTETLMTEVSPLLRAFAIIHAGVALGIVVLFIGMLFTPI